MRSSTPGRVRVEHHPARTRCPPRRAPCVRDRTSCRHWSGWPPRAPTPCRSSPCTAVPGNRSAGHRATRRCRRTTTRPSPRRHRRQGRARRRGDGALRRRPTHARRAPRPLSAHSSTAENCGRPTPVIIRVVHIAPGPTPTLRIDAPASTRSRTPSAETMLPATTGTRGSSLRTASSASIMRSWCPWAVSSTSVSIPAASSASALAPTSPFTPMAAATRSRPWRRGPVRTPSPAVPRCGSGHPRAGRMRRPPARIGGGPSRGRRRPPAR